MQAFRSGTAGTSALMAREKHKRRKPRGESTEAESIGADQSVLVMKAPVAQDWSEGRSGHCWSVWSKTTGNTRCRFIRQGKPFKR